MNVSRRCDFRNDADRVGVWRLLCVTTTLQCASGSSSIASAYNQELGQAEPRPLRSTSETLCSSQWLFELAEQPSPRATNSKRGTSLTLKGSEQCFANDLSSSFLLLTLAPGGRSVQIGLERGPAYYDRSGFQPVIKTIRKLFRFHLSLSLHNS